ncbi:hypothetical protein [Piscinibacter sakaiensis]|uniref:hypothetical protein n=1 Tax=Piscinibacter sakaiensis TaxID=1547922 RepID=UPI003AAEECD5
MLLIRTAQLTAIDLARQQEQQAWMIQALTGSYRTGTRRPARHQASETVRIGFERARSHGFVRQADIFEFVKLVRRWGHGFGVDDATAWARVILAKRHASSRQRLHALVAESERRIAASGLAGTGDEETRIRVVAMAPDPAGEG